MTLLSRRAVVQVFLAFALAYFLSALIRAITATLSPVLMQEFSLQARDLGLLGGAYFLGFSMTQLPLGTWLDRHGPRRVLLGFLTVLWISRPAADLSVRPLDAQVSGSAGTAEETPETLPRRGAAVLVDKKAKKK